MNRNTSAWLLVVGCSLLCWMTACAPTKQGAKDPDYQKAKQMYQSRDYKEAVKYYQQALENNPRNASAHLELGLLYEEKFQDYTYAIYHYRRYLELGTDAEKKKLVQQFVDRSKLAFTDSIALHKDEELVRLKLENSSLLNQVHQLTQANQDQVVVVMQTNVWMASSVMKEDTELVHPVLTHSPK